MGATDTSPDQRTSRRQRSRRCGRGGGTHANGQRFPRSTPAALRSPVWPPPPRRQPHKQAAAVAAAARARDSASAALAAAPRWTLRPPATRAPTAAWDTDGCGDSVEGEEMGRGGGRGGEGRDTRGRGGEGGGRW